MKPYLQEPGTTLYHGHTLDVLRNLPEESVHCVVTSPPYWGLRDYGLQQVVWGCGGCEHEWGDLERIAVGRNDGGRDISGGKGNYQNDGPHKSSVLTGQFCRHCNSWRGSLGLEPTPELYVEHLVQVFREVRRVLRKDGTLWLNLGDSYASSASGQSFSSSYGSTAGSKTDTLGGFGHIKTARNPRKFGLKPKDLVGIPWRVAFALQADGWYLRSDIIWSKPNPMPESVTDRPTKAHEYLFLLAKNQRYYWDKKAVADRAIEAGRIKKQGEKSLSRAQAKGFKIKPSGNASKDFIITADLRNIRTVWTIPTQPFPEAHFAVFPEKLVEPCVKAGCPEGGTVLDPFCGSGTTLAVARRFGCDAIGIDASSEYLEVAKRRLVQRVLFLAGATEQLPSNRGEDTDGRL